MAEATNNSTTATTTTTSDGTTVTPGPVDTTDWKAKADAAAAELARVKDADKKAKADAAAAKKKADEDKAIKEGEIKNVLQAREAELEAERAKATELETAMRARIDRMIEALPEESKAKVDLVKDSLPLAKLEAFVESEAAGVVTSPSPTAPPSSSPGKATGNKELRELQPRTYEILGEMNRGAEAAENAERVIDPTSGDYKFEIPIKKLISKLNSISPGSVRLNRKNADERKAW